MSDSVIKTEINGSINIVLGAKYTTIYSYEI